MPYALDLFHMVVLAAKTQKLSLMQTSWHLSVTVKAIGRHQVIHRLSIGRITTLHLHLQVPVSKLTRRPTTALARKDVPALGETGGSPPMQMVDAVNAALMECKPFAINDAKVQAFLEVYDSGLVEDNTVHQTRLVSIK
ncbi:hypothetical protein JOM56_015395 [Amanita muscaria]